MKGIDFGYGKISGKLIKESEYDFVCRYLSHNTAKNITKEELQDFKNNNLKVVLIWETTENRTLDGYQAGIDDAHSVLNQLIQLGFQWKEPIYFAVDSDMNLKQLEIIKDYFKGITSVILSSYVGVYGSYLTVKTLLDSELVFYAWQTYAWSHGQWDSRAQLRQIINGTPKLNGIVCDTNESMQDDFGQLRI